MAQVGVHHQNDFRLSCSGTSHDVSGKTFASIGVYQSYETLLAAFRPFFHSQTGIIFRTTIYDYDFGRQADALHVSGYLLQQWINVFCFV
jgi:hypothetical protein